MASASTRLSVGLEVAVLAVGLLLYGSLMTSPAIAGAGVGRFAAGVALGALVGGTAVYLTRRDAIPDRFYRRFYRFVGILAVILVLQVLLELLPAVSRVGTFAFLVVVLVGRFPVYRSVLLSSGG